MDAVDPTVEPPARRVVAGLRVTGRLLAWPAVVFALLLALWPTVRDPYVATFRGATNLTFAIAGWSEVRLEVSRETGNAETRIAYRSSESDDSRPLFHTSFRAQYFGYVPSAILVALVVGASSGRRRRLRTLLWSGALLHLGLCLRLAVLIGCVWFAYLQNHPDGAPTSTAWRGGKRATETIDRIVNRDPTFFAFLPVFLWALFAWRFENWRERLAGRAGENRNEDEGEDEGEGEGEKN